MTFLSTPFSLATASTTSNSSLLMLLAPASGSRRTDCLIFGIFYFLAFVYLAWFFFQLRHQPRLMDVAVRDVDTHSILFQRDDFASHREDRSLEAAAAIQR